MYSPRIKWWWSEMSFQLVSDPQNPAKKKFPWLEKPLCWSSEAVKTNYSGSTTDISLLCPSFWCEWSTNSLVWMHVDAFHRLVSNFLEFIATVGSLGVFTVKPKRPLAKHQLGDALKGHTKDTSLALCSSVPASICLGKGPVSCFNFLQQVFPLSQDLSVTFQSIS